MCHPAYRRALQTRNAGCQPSWYDNHVYPLETRKSRFYITDVVTHGNSGGPVFDISGNVIGVVVQKIVFSRINLSTREIISEKHFGTAIGLGTLKEFLSQHAVNAEGGSYRVQDGDSIQDEATSYIVNVQCRLSD